MAKYIIRRLLLMIPTLIGITMVVFFVMAMSPGGVGGVMMTEFGEMEAERAKALREYYQKRYGLDKPLIVQYFRWLNRVSPIGFRTSSQIEFTSGDRDKIRGVVESAEAFDSKRPVDEAVNCALAIAAYNKLELTESTELIVESLSDRDKALALFGRLGSEPGDAFVAKYESELETDPNAARNLLIAELSNVANGADRVLFSSFALKAPDLGRSWAKGRTVTDLYKEALPITILLNVVSTPIIYFIAIFAGIYAARHRGKFIDVASGTTMIGLWSMPTIWAGVLLIGFLASEQYIRWFPTGGLNSPAAEEMTFLPSMNAGGFERGWLLDRIWHLFLPIICMTYGGFAFLSKLMRSAMLENMHADFVRTARAKGVDEGTVLWQHTFRNSLLPLITVAAYLIPGLIAGSIIVEKIFSIQGMGYMMIDAVFARDREVVLANTLVAGLVTLVCLLIADVCYAIADPRVSYE